MKYLSVFLLFCCPLLPQDLQNRTVVKTPLDLGDHWYVVFWSITNLKAESPNNTNIFPGVGYRGKTWWVEGMAQKQWNGSGGLYSIDIRFRKQLTQRLSLYVEPSVILTNPSFYEFVILESRVWKKLSVGGETENVHRLNKQLIAAGPRVSYSLGQRWGCEFAASFAYRFSPTGKDEARLYLNITRRVRLRP